MEQRIESPINVLIVEDQTLLRQALRRLLESENGVRVVGEAGTCAEALRLAADRAREFGRRAGGMGGFFRGSR